MSHAPYSPLLTYHTSHPSFTYFLKQTIFSRRPCQNNSNTIAKIGNRVNLIRHTATPTAEARHLFTPWGKEVSGDWGECTNVKPVAEWLRSNPDCLRGKFVPWY